MDTGRLSQALVANKARAASNSTHLVANLDALSTPAWKQHLVSDLDGHGLDLAVLVWRAWTGSNHISLWQRRRCCRRWEEETGCGLLCCLEPLEEDSVQEGLDGGDGSDC